MFRIGFDGRALASPAAGMRRYTHELFAALARRDPSLTVVAIGTPDDTSVPDGVERAEGASSLPTNAGWMLTGLPRAAHRAQIDLFHAPSYTVPFAGPRPLVVTIHDVSYERHPEWYPYKRGPLRRAFYRRSAHHADRIITDSLFSKTEIVHAYDIDANRIDVVPLAAAATFVPGPRLALPAGCPPRFVLHVGDLHVRRNLPMLARAIAALRARRAVPPDLALAVAGVDRGTGEELRQISSSAGGDSPLVFVAGKTTEAELLALYRAASALVYPSRYEGFGLPLLEAMACGTPVIAARTSSIPEVVGDAGILLDPDDEAAWMDAIERVLADEGYAATLREMGIARARMFSWPRTAEETAAVYHTLLDRRS